MTTMPSRQSAIFILALAALVLQGCETVHHARIQVAAEEITARDREAVVALKYLAEGQDLRCSSNPDDEQLGAPVFLECSHDEHFARVTLVRSWDLLTVELFETGGSSTPEGFRDLFHDITDEMSRRYGDAAVYVTYPL